MNGRHFRALQVAGATLASPASTMVTLHGPSLGVFVAVVVDVVADRDVMPVQLLEPVVQVRLVPFAVRTQWASRPTRSIRPKSVENMGISFVLAKVFPTPRRSPIPGAICDDDSAGMAPCGDLAGVGTSKITSRAMPASHRPPACRKPTG